MKDEKQAGALAARNIAVLEQAWTVLADVESAVGAAIDHLGQEIIASRGWSGKFDDGKKQQWFAPPGTELGGKARGTYSLEWSGDEDHFWLSTLCGAGQAEAGIRFTVDYKELTLKAAWKKFAAEANVHRPELKALGFRYEEGEGSWFRPFRLDTNLVADAYENDEYEAALAPLQDAIAAAEKSMPIFSRVLEDAKARFARQK